MEDEIVREIMKECNLWERIRVMIFKSTYVKVYKKGVKAGYNWSNRVVR